MSDISKINIGGGLYSLKDEYIRNNCIRTDLLNLIYTIYGDGSLNGGSGTGGTIAFNCGLAWEEGISWNPLRFLYKYRYNDDIKTTDICTFNIVNRNNDDKSKMDLNIHNYRGDITVQSNDFTTVATSCNINSQYVRFTEWDEIRLNPSIGDDDTALVCIRDDGTFLTMGTDHLSPQTKLKAYVHTNNTLLLMYSNVENTNPALSISKGSSFIEIDGRYIRKVNGNDSFISGFDVISLVEASSRSNAKKNRTIVYESDVVKIKYDSACLVQVGYVDGQNDNTRTVRLIGNEVLICQHLTDGTDKTYRLCDMLQAVENLNNLKQYEYDSSSETLKINKL